MVAEFTSLTQITIPEEITNKIGATIGDKFNIAIHGKNIVLTPISEKPWIASDIWESEELIPSSLVKAAGLHDWDKEGFTYPQTTQLSNGSIADNFNAPNNSPEERMNILRSLSGSIDDPTFIVPPEVSTPDSPRNRELLDL